MHDDHVRQRMFQIKTLINNANVQYGKCMYLHQKMSITNRQTCSSFHYFKKSMYDYFAFNPIPTFVGIVYGKIIFWNYLV